MIRDWRGKAKIVTASTVPPQISIRLTEIAKAVSGAVPYT